MSFLGIGLGPPPSEGGGGGQSDFPAPIPGSTYLQTLHRYLVANLSRLAPSLPSSSSSSSRSTTPTMLQQSYTLLTLGLDPSSQPLSRSLKVPLTLGFGSPSPPPPRPRPSKPLSLRLPPDRLLFLLLRWQSLPQGLKHVGRTDVPLPSGVMVAAKGRWGKADGKADGDVGSVRSWVGSVRSVSMGSIGGMSAFGGGWLGRGARQMDEDQLLLSLYSMFNVLPALLIHPPSLSDSPIADLIDAGGYTQLGGIDVRVPLDVCRNLQILELEGYDPRALLIPPNPQLRSLTVRDVQDGDDWLVELLSSSPSDPADTTPTTATARFPHLQHLSLPSCSFLSLPSSLPPLPHLTHLDLSSNLLAALPSALASLPALTSLNLSHNLITSLRTAPSTLGNVHTLNLSHNRIDCLVGLERVLGLERVDVRGNELGEVGEVGRLAVIPCIREIWCAGNAFDRDEGWRVEVGVELAREGRRLEEVVLDDRAWTWAEKRKVEGEVLARGGVRRKARVVEEAHELGTGTGTGGEATTDSPTSSRAQGSVGGKKRRPRRVINLDPDPMEEERVIVGGSMRLPPRAKTIDEEEENGNGRIGNAQEEEEEENGAQKVVVGRKAGRRARVSASMFEPRTSGDG